jgi:activator of HSP90 ATPase
MEDPLKMKMGLKMRVKGDVEIMKREGGIEVLMKMRITMEAKKVEDQEDTGGTMEIIMREGIIGIMRGTIEIIIDMRGGTKDIMTHMKVARLSSLHFMERVIRKHILIGNLKWINCLKLMTLETNGELSWLP